MTQACEVFRCLQIRNTQSNQPISVQCSISYRKQSFDLHSKSNNWFLYEMQHWAEVGLVRMMNLYMFLIAKNTCRISLN